MKQRKREDLTGRVFGHLTVLKYDKDNSNDVNMKTRYWICQCDCGNIVPKSERELLHLNIQACSHNSHADLTEQRFGMLTVISRADKTDKYHNIYWNVICDCGTKKVLHTNGLKHTKSCGCIVAERMRENAATYQSEEDRLRALKIMHEKTIKDGINFGILNGKISSKNKSGHKGVFWDSSKGRWQAAIGYKSKQYRLCYSKDINYCICIREQAHEAINNGTFEKFYSQLKGE